MSNSSAKSVDWTSTMQVLTFSEVGLKDSSYTYCDWFFCYLLLKTWLPLPYILSRYAGTLPHFLLLCQRNQEIFTFVFWCNLSSRNLAHTLGSPCGGYSYLFSFQLLCFKKLHVQEDVFSDLIDLYENTRAKENDPLHSSK